MASKTTLFALCGASLFLLVGSSGCTVKSDTCAPDGTVACAGGTGYSCTGVDSPEDSDSSIVCSSGEAGNAGSTLYCCVDRFSATSSCGVDSTVVGCEPPSIGFSCTSTDTPADADPTLSCSAGVPGNAGSTLYCCQ